MLEIHPKFMSQKLALFKEARPMVQKKRRLGGREEISSGRGGEEASGGKLHSRSQVYYLASERYYGEEVEWAV